MTDKTCTTCGRAISMERGLQDNKFWESRAPRNVFCTATGIMMATADCAPLCKGRFWIEKQEERICTLKLIDEYDGGEGWTYAECSACGAQFTCPEAENADKEVFAYDWVCCPVCRAKVVDDD